MIEQTAQLKASEFENVLPFCVEHMQAGRRVCLMTLINIEGASPRPLGSQIAVTDVGRSAGMITGGCAEEALIKHALHQFDVPEAERQTVLRLGSDSPWVDIRLPCGAGIDVHFSFPKSATVFEEAIESLAARNSSCLELETASGRWHATSKITVTGLRDDRAFVRRWDPSTRILIVGAGPYVDALSSLGAAVDRAVVRCGECPPAPELLDPYSAFVLLMHDHNNEPAILQLVLQSECFYVGALGSRTSHARRSERLAQIGVSEKSIARIHGPVGLAIGAKTPHEIALSILAEITLKKNQRFSNV